MIKHSSLVRHQKIQNLPKNEIYFPNASYFHEYSFALKLSMKLLILSLQNDIVIESFPSLGIQINLPVFLESIWSSSLLHMHLQTFSRHLRFDHITLHLRTFCPLGNIFLSYHAIPCHSLTHTRNSVVIDKFHICFRNHCI